MSGTDIFAPISVIDENEVEVHLLSLATIAADLEHDVEHIYRCPVPNRQDDVAGSEVFPFADQDKFLRSGELWVVGTWDEKLRAAFCEGVQNFV